MSDQTREDEFSIHWIQDVLNDVLARDEDQFLISSGKSPSGSIHIGILRELIIADVIKRKLLEMGKRARTIFFIDDYDPLRSFPPSVTLSIDEWAGVPYSDVPDPFGCCKSFGAHWANELIETFPDFGLDPEIVWNSELYESGRMMPEVRTCLQQTQTIRDIMIEYVARDFDAEQRAQYIESMKTWYPASVICPVCGHIQSGVKGSIVPNRITVYDAASDEVSFTCTNCGHSDTELLSKLRVKLTWRIDWPARWHLFKITCEPAGKDHAVKGGSYDTGLEVSRRVFGWSGPVKVPYEWVQIGGHDMSTSAGIVFTPNAWRSIAPPEVYRFMMLKTDLQRTINIQPEQIPDMVDKYDHLERIYYGLEQATPEHLELARLLYPLCEAGPTKEYVPKVPFKYAVLSAQLTDLLGQTVILEKSMEVLRRQFGLKSADKTVIEQIQTRLVRALNWVRQEGTDRDRVEVPNVVPDEVRNTLTDADRRFLRSFVEAIKGKTMTDDEIQSMVFITARQNSVPDRRAFQVLYRILISRPSGPRLGPFLNLLGVDWVVKRISTVL